MPLRDFVGFLRFENKASAPLRQAAASTQELGTAMAKAQVAVGGLDAALKSAGASVAQAARQAGIATKDYGEFRKAMGASIGEQGKVISSNKELAGGLSACAVKSKIAGAAWQQYKSGVISTNAASVIAVDKTAMLRQEMSQLELGYRNAGRSIFTMRNAMVGLGLVAFIRSTLEAASSIEQVRFRLTALTGSVGEANKRIDTATKLAARIPATLQEVQESAAILESFGANSDKWLEPVTDLAYVMGVSVPEAARSFGRAFAGGVGAADVFRERGILTLIRDTNKLDDLTRLTLPQFRQAMERTFTENSRVAGAGTRAITTWAGQLSLVQDAWFKLRMAVAEAGLLDGMKGLARAAAALLSVLTDIISFAPSLTSGLAAAGIAALTTAGLLMGLARAVLVVKTAWLGLNILLGTAGGPLGIAIVAVAALAAGIGTWLFASKAVKPVTKELTQTVEQFGSATEEAVERMALLRKEFEIENVQRTIQELEELRAVRTRQGVDIAKVSAAIMQQRVELVKLKEKFTEGEKAESDYTKRAKELDSTLEQLSKANAQLAENWLDLRGLGQAESAVQDVLLRQRKDAVSAQKELVFEYERALTLQRRIGMAGAVEVARAKKTSDMLKQETDAKIRLKLLEDAGLQDRIQEVSLLDTKVDLEEKLVALKVTEAALRDPELVALRERIRKKEEETALQQQQEEALRRGAGWISSWGDAWKGVSSQIGPAFKEFAERPIEFRKLWVGFFDSVQQSTANWIDAWLQGARKGKEAFKDFTKSILASFRQMVAQMIAQAAMQRAAAGLAGMLGFPAMAAGAPGGAPGAAGGVAGAAGQQGGMPGLLPGIGGYSGLQVTGAVAGAAIAYQGYRKGDIGQGAAGGALTGFSLAGPVGAAVGAVVGAAAGALGRDKARHEKTKSRGAEREAKLQRIRELSTEAAKLPPQDQADVQAALASALQYLGNSRLGNSPGNWSYNMQGADAGIAEAEAIINHAKAKRAILTTIAAKFGGGMAARATVAGTAALLSGGLTRKETGAVLQAAAQGGGGGGRGGVDVGGVNVTNNIQATIASDIDIQQLADRLGQGVVEQFISAIPAV